VIFYIVSRKLRTTSGLSFLLFLVPLTVAYVCDFLFRVIRENAVLSSIKLMTICNLSLVVAFVWLSVMTFDMMWTFCRFRKPSKTLKRFWFYLIFVIALAVAVYFLLGYLPSGFGRNLINPIVGFVAVMALMDVIFIVIAGYKVFQLSKTSSRLEHSRFEEETLKSVNLL
jgi:hypothetical protein